MPRENEQVSSANSDFVRGFSTVLPTPATRLHTQRATQHDHVLGTQHHIRSAGTTAIRVAISDLAHCDYSWRRDISAKAEEELGVKYQWR